MSSDKKDGIGAYHKEKAYYAQRKIFQALADGEWHRNMELRAKTKLSSRTLIKHLDEMVHVSVIERKVDTESKKYPTPVFYRATPALLAYFKSSELREEFSQNVDAMLAETKDPLVVLEMINSYGELGFLRLLKEIKSNKDISFEFVEFFENVFLFASYRSFVFNLVQASQRIIDDLDLEGLESRIMKKLEELGEGREERR